MHQHNRGLENFARNASRHRVLSRKLLEFEGGVNSGRAQQQNRRAGAEGDYALTRYTTATEEDIFDNWLHPIETDPRTKVSGFIETMIEEELATDLSRPRDGRRPVKVGGLIN
jgi:hypothetical protein